MKLTSVKLPERDVIYQNEQFTIDKYDYNLQYFPYYKSRLSQMREALVKNATETWPDLPVCALTELAENKEDTDENSSQDSADVQEPMQLDHCKEVIILGTLLKKMSSQPSILKEIDDERKISAPLEAPSTKFISKDDVIFLQEGDERIELKGDIQINRFCTGICLAAKGHVNPHGSGFIVDDICFAWNDDQPVDKPLLPHDYYVLIVSGLGFHNNMNNQVNLTRSLNLLFDILSGNSDIILDKTIVNMIVAGNSVSPRAREAKDADGSKTWDRKAKSYAVEAVKLLDKFLANVGQYMFIDVMPGLTDLATYLWPQQPLHPCMFPNAHRLNSIRSVTNPHRATYYGVDFLGTSGQNVDSVRSCTSMDETTEIMRHMLEWGHIAPTCPDLLHSYPFSGNDPLRVTNYPDVFFAGNQPDFTIGSFISPTGKSVRLVSVPAFDEKSLGILVNLRTFNCEMLAFN